MGLCWRLSSPVASGSDVRHAQLLTDVALHADSFLCSASNIFHLSAPYRVNLFAPLLLSLVQICLRLVQTDALLLSKLGLPGLVQLCLDRVHTKPVCMCSIG